MTFSLVARFDDRPGPAREPPSPRPATLRAPGQPPSGWPGSPPRRPWVLRCNAALTERSRTRAAAESVQVSCETRWRAAFQSAQISIKCGQRFAAEHPSATPAREAGSRARCRPCGAFAGQPDCWHSGAREAGHEDAGAGGGDRRRHRRLQRALSPDPARLAGRRAGRAGRADRGLDLACRRQLPELLHLLERDEAAGLQQPAVPGAAGGGRGARSAIARAAASGWRTAGTGWRSSGTSRAWPRRRGWRSRS